MKKSSMICAVYLCLCMFTVSADEVEYTVKDVQTLLRNQEPGNWRQKHFGSGLKYLVSFESENHRGKLNWNKNDIREGKIDIIKAMDVARNWVTEKALFGIKEWGIESVTLHFNPGIDQVEYIYSISITTLLTAAEHKSVQVFVLPNHELITPEFDPEL